MKGSVRSKLVSACFPFPEPGENRHLRWEGGFTLWSSALLLLNVKWVLGVPKNMVNDKGKHFLDLGVGISYVFSSKI